MSLNLTARQIAKSAVLASGEKKGIRPLLLDMRRVSDIADYFVIVHGTSDRHVRTIAEAIVDQLHKRKLKPNHVEGLNQGSWVLVDYGSVIVHVFHAETRKFYNLERLWGDAKVVRMTRHNERSLKSAHRSGVARHSR